ncbi:UNVERIFIED_CONTAM: hypothetical protein FKN15_052009, partial [Acipenser sinensis]
VEFVKEQQKDIIEKLKCEIQAAEESISVTGTEELLSSLEVIPSDLEEIPKQVLLLHCPYPDLKALLLNEFQTFGNKYKSRLQNINERLKALDSYNHFKEFLSLLEVIPSDLDQIPMQVLLLLCPCPDLKALLLNEFQTFGNKYKSRLQNINERLKALDRYRCRNLLSL